MVVHAIYNAGGIRSTDLEMQYFDTKVQCLEAAKIASKMIDFYPQDSRIQYECIKNESN